MPTPASFRSRLVAREPMYGAWSVIPSPLSVRLLAAAGLDYVVIDLQHGGATEADLPAMTTAIRLAGAAPSPGSGMQAPPISAGPSTWAAKASSSPTSTRPTKPARWPARSATRPEGTGPRAGSWPQTTRSASSWPSRPPRWRTSTPPPAVDGVDGIYVGPRDLSLSLGCELDLDDQVFNRALKRVWGACAAAGKPVGVHATDAAHRPPVPRRRLHLHHGHRRRGRDHPGHRRPAQPRPRKDRGVTRPRSAEDFQAGSFRARRAFAATSRPSITARHKAAS